MTRGEGTLLREIDTEAVRDAALGLSPEDVWRASAERFALARPPEIHLGPDWLPYVVPVDCRFALAHPSEVDWMRRRSWREGVMSDT